MPYKSIALEDAQFKMDADEATFSGYASTFGNVDSYGDTIVKGAYAETLEKYGPPRMFFNHKADAVPLGKWVEAKEDDHGLLLRGEFTPGNALAQEVRSALKHGTLDSLSIGYSLKKGDYEDRPNGRLIKKVARLAETSIVTFPADTFAKVDLASVKDDLVAEIVQIETIRDFEYFLRDASGFSKGAAQALTARVKTLFAARDADEEAKAKKAAMLEALQKLAA